VHFFLLSEPAYLSEFSDYATDWSTGVRFPAGADRLWGPPSQRLFAGVKAAGGVKLTTHHRLVPMLKMRRAVPPLRIAW
jgi:hypothetical protein